MSKKNGDPHGPCRGRTGRKAVRFNDRPVAVRKQPQPEPCKPILARADLARTFFCAFCGATRPEGDLVGRDGALLFCSQCVDALDGLDGAPVDALAVFRRTS